MPISTWSAAISGIAENLGTGITGLRLFMQTIPYNFYSLLTIVFVLGIILLNADYGKMRAAETKAVLHGELGAAEPEGKSGPPSVGGSADTSGAVMADLMIPIISLVISCTFFMIYVGGFFGATPWCGAENAGDVAAAFGATDTFVALPCGAAIALLFSCLYFSFRRTIGVKEMAACFPQGLCAMAPGILLLVLAMALKTITTHLGTAVYVQRLVMGLSSEIYGALPAILFLVSVLLAFSTGTSYGTFGVMLPIAASVFPVDSTLLIVGLSACLAGAVCGDHCSPISDTTVMASAGAQASHMEHVETQIPYVAPVASVSFGMYLLAGFWQNWLGCLGIGSLLLLLFLLFLSGRKSV
jgi:Na+/H+ antiporter NhaC